MPELLMLLDLSTTGPKYLLETQAADVLSIQTQVIGTTWNTAVITLKASNSLDGPQYDLGTPVTISADGLTDITTSDWQPYRYLWLVCTTAGSARTLIEVDIIMKDT